MSWGTLLQCGGLSPPLYSIVNEKLTLPLVPAGTPSFTECLKSASTTTVGSVLRSIFEHECSRIVGAIYRRPV